MLTSDFNYDLPPELIAQTPIEPRNASRLMVLTKKDGGIAHHRFNELADFLQEGDTLIFNDTRVMPSRLIGHRESGGRVEVFLLRRLDYTRWEALTKPGKKSPIGTKIIFADDLSATVESVTDFGGRIVSFVFDGVFEEILHRLGQTPLPPYIHTKLADGERYQTVYAREEGSAAAPTAGLHFTTDQLANLKARGIKLGYLTLHVGLGTFRPVKSAVIEDHVMHREYFSLPEETAQLITAAKAVGKRVIAVGTTAVRTLEAAASAKDTIKGQSGSTDIFIYPGYRFKIVDAMITNFHLPQSTLIMLVSAFAGREFTLKAYEEAVKERYRFFSFGDAMLIVP